MNLTDFLMARIAEDEAAASAWLDGARKLADCEAKRRIVSRCDLIVRGRDVGMFDEGRLQDANDNLRSLAAVYADHPDYEQEWRV